MHDRKNPINIDEGFTCDKCKMPVAEHPDGSCRNHCSHCLYSKHVDLKVPGDRENECQGLMKPIGVENNKKKGIRLVHLCQNCGEKMVNRTASDDNWDLICELSRVPQ